VRDESRNWLEHYNAACHYALFIVNDPEEDPGKRKYAHKSVDALECAARHGGQVEFLTSKKYWLQAGDPDLAGLRQYSCFRAFEARVYGHPMPSTAELSKYELYGFLRAVVRQAAGDLENAWRKRASLSIKRVTVAEFDRWWRQELRAWEVSIRIGRFYRQWQTRHAALDAIRNWFESSGPEARPIPYPNIEQEPYRATVGNYKLVKSLLGDTEDIFGFLANKCGSLTKSSDGESDTVYGNTLRWNQHTETRGRLAVNLSQDEFESACRSRSAVWAALRHWARSPGSDGKREFRDSLTRLSVPPE
jgi:hypothetical protein